jgi:siroheme synthase-like protein
MPLMVDLKKVVIFGGERGEGLQKTQKLSFFTDELLLVPEVSTDQERLLIPKGRPSELKEKLIRTEERWIPIHPQAAKDADLESLISQANFVVSDLSDPLLNEEIFAIATRHGVLCNVIDTKPLCNTWFMSLLQTDHLLVGLSTKGQAAFLSAQLRQKLQPWIERQDKRARFWVELLAQLNTEGRKSELAALRSSSSLRFLLAVFGPRTAQRWAQHLLHRRGFLCKTPSSKI